jgi:3-oxoacyl-[acyl-carrier protein] reductase
MRLQGKTALIAGAGRNNGKAIALAFAREGADLILISRSREKELQAVAQECEDRGVQTVSLLGELGDHSEVNRMVVAGVKHFGKVDVLVSAVGIRLSKLPWEFSYDEWHNVFEVNLHSTFYLVKALAPTLLQRKSGSIIALGGNSALTSSSPHGAALAASKHGLYGLIKGLAQAFGPHGIRANLLSLANIENNRLNPEWYQGTGQIGDPNLSDAARKQLSPLGRQGTSREVANVAVFLASDDSSYVTGDRIICAGGMYM